MGIKNILLAITACCFAGTIQAQLVSSWGPKASLNYTYADVTQEISSGGFSYKYLSEDADVGFNYGLYFRLNPGQKKFLLQPEVLFSQSNFVTSANSLTLDTITKLSVNRIDVPLLIGFKFKQKNAFMVGPVYTKIVEVGPGESEFWSDELSGFFNDGKWGLQASLSRQLTYCFGVDIRYETNLSKFGDSVTIRGREFEFDYRNHLIMVGLHLNFSDQK